VTSIVIQVIISGGQFISMGVALWPVAGPACVWRNGTTVRTHAIRSLKSRPVVVLSSAFSAVPSFV